MDFAQGLFFPFFGGSKISDFFAASNYDVYGLQYRDFTAGTSVNDPTGALFLSQYIDRVRLSNRNTPPALVTNLNIPTTCLHAHTTSSPAWRFTTSWSHAIHHRIQCSRYETSCSFQKRWLMPSRAQTLTHPDGFVSLHACVHHALHGSLE